MKIGAISLGYSPFLDRVVNLVTHSERKCSVDFYHGNFFKVDFLSSDMQRHLTNLQIILNATCCTIVLIREFKITSTPTATATSLNKRFNEQNNCCARTL